MNKILKIIYAFFICLNPVFAYANEVATVTEHKCRIDGCRVKCAVGKDELQTIGTAKSIKIEIYKSGVTKLYLNKAIDGVQTIVMGGSGYICSIENQEN